MTTVTITRQTHVAMLKHLVAGHDLEFVAAATRVPRDTVLDIVSRHGYPAVDKMAWAIDILIKEQDKLPERAPANPRSEVFLDEIDVPVSARAPQTPRPSSFALIAPATGQPATSSTALLLNEAAQSPFIRTQNLGVKISALLVNLTDRLADEQEARDAKVKAEKADAAVAARIAVLEAEIAKLKRKPAKTPKTTGASHATRAVLTGEFSCTMDSCDRVFDTSQGVALHQRRAHEGFNPRTVNAA